MIRAEPRWVSFDFPLLRFLAIYFLPVSLGNQTMVQFSTVRKLCSILWSPRTKPVPPKAPVVLLSVWNRFRNIEQRKAFEEAGLPVHWIGNHFPPTADEVSKRSFAWLSFLLLMSRSFKIKCLDFALNKASLWTFDVFSGHRRIREQVVWAYVEMNTRLLRRAKKQGIPTILDNPIAHMRNYYEVNKAENAALGLPFDDKYNRWWTRQAEQEYALADHLVCGSNFVKETLVAQGVPAEKIYVLHTGVNTTLWNESFEARQNRTASDRFTVIFTGYVGPRKGIRFLVQAWVKANLPNADLFLVGGGSDVFPWNRVVDQLPSSIHLLGARKHAELKDLYGRCDIFVIPSLLEGFVRSGLEAMAAGLPVIYTHETGLDDVIDHGVEGWRVPAHDVDSLCAQFQWCYDHREDVLLAGKRAHEKMMNQSMESYGEQCVNLVRSICEKG